MLLQRLGLIVHLSVVLLSSAMFVNVALAQDKSPTARQLVGTVLGRPVYRDEIVTNDRTTVSDEMSRLFLGPAMEAYRKSHSKDSSPSSDELAVGTRVLLAQAKTRMDADAIEHRRRTAELKAKLAAGASGTEVPKDESGAVTGMAINEELKQIEVVDQLGPPGPEFAEMIIRQWKYQRHLYDTFGGGRILWQQFGIEAFDAMHQWIKAQEAAGVIKVTDPSLRSAMLEYWETMRHGHFLVSDPARIKMNFLTPPWEREPPAPTSSSGK